MYPVQLHWERIADLGDMFGAWKSIFVIELFFVSLKCFVSAKLSIITAIKFHQTG